MLYKNVMVYNKKNAVDKFLQAPTK